MNPVSYLNLQFVTQSLRNAYGPARRCLLGLFNVKTGTVPLVPGERRGARGGEASPAPQRAPAGSSPAEKRGEARNRRLPPRPGSASPGRAEPRSPAPLRAAPRFPALPRAFPRNPRLHLKILRNINKVGGGAS